MARRSFGVKDAVGEVAEGGGGLTTPPPPGNYKAQVLKMQLGLNRNGQDMITVIHKIQIPDAKKELKKHDGYWVYNRFNMTDQGAPYFNAFLNALAGSEAKGLALQEAVWDKGLLTTDKDLGDGPNPTPVDVTAIGSFKIGSPNGVRMIGISVVDRTYTRKNKETGQPEEVDTVDINRYMPASGTAAVSGGGDGLDDDELADDLGGSSDGLDDAGGDDLDDLDGGSGSESSEGDAAASGDPEADAFNAELDAITELKALRLKARDEYGIEPAATKGKTEDEVRDMIFDAWDEKRAGASTAGDDLDDLDDLDEKPKATRRGTKSETEGEPPF